MPLDLINWVLRCDLFFYLFAPILWWNGGGCGWKFARSRGSFSAGRIRGFVLFWWFYHCSSWVGISIWRCPCGFDFWSGGQLDSQCSAGARWDRCGGELFRIFGVIGKCTWHRGTNLDKRELTFVWLTAIWVDAHHLDLAVGGRVFRVLAHNVVRNLFEDWHYIILYN